jgi:hypothetical protein
MMRGRLAGGLVAAAILAAPVSPSPICKFIACRVLASPGTVEALFSASDLSKKPLLQ